MVFTSPGDGGRREPCLRCQNDSRLLAGNAGGGGHGVCWDRPWPGAGDRQMKISDINHFPSELSADRKGAAHKDATGQRDTWAVTASKAGRAAGLRGPGRALSTRRASQRGQAEPVRRFSVVVMLSVQEIVVSSLCSPRRTWRARSLGPWETPRSAYPTPVVADVGTQEGHQGARSGLLGWWRGGRGVPGDLSDTADVLPACGPPPASRHHLQFM